MLKPFFNYAVCEVYKFCNKCVILVPFFSLILGYLSRCEAISASDYVEFSNFMAHDRKYSRKCGQLKEFDIESDRKFFRVTFRSNDRLDGTGFNATYKFLDEVDLYTPKPSQKNMAHKTGRCMRIQLNYQRSLTTPVISLRVLFVIRSQIGQSVRIPFTFQL